MRMIINHNCIAAIMSLLFNDFNEFEGVSLRLKGVIPHASKFRADSSPDTHHGPMLKQITLHMETIIASGTGIVPLEIVHSNPVKSLACAYNSSCCISFININGICGTTQFPMALFLAIKSSPSESRTSTPGIGG